jgi:hypothetical protein
VTRGTGIAPCRYLGAVSSEEKLAARLDEDEALAKAAAPGPWLLENSDSDPYWNGHDWEFGPDASARHNVVRHWRIKGPHVTIDTATNDAYFVPDLRHIARHDPARASRFVDAVRAIIRESNGEGHGRAEHEPAYYAGLGYAVSLLAEIYED